MKKLGFAFAMSIILTFACKPTTYLYSLNSKLIKTNRLDNDSIKFEFWLTGQGVYFTINNMTEENATLLWDESYIVDPTGNAQKVFNQEILEENIKDQNVALKTLNTTLIPAGKSVSRFTSSISSLGKELYVFNSNWANNRFIYSDYVVFKKTTTQNYWPNGLFVDPNDPGVDVNQLLGSSTSKILKRPTLSIGFAIKQGGNQKNYNFDFLVDTVNVFQVNISESKTYFIGECIMENGVTKCNFVPQKNMVGILQMKTGENLYCIIDSTHSEGYQIRNLKNGKKQFILKTTVVDEVPKYYSSLGNLLKE